MRIPWSLQGNKDTQQALQLFIESKMGQLSARIQRRCDFMIQCLVTVSLSGLMNR